jgi:uncharacterized protein (DUF2236 family)
MLAAELLDLRRERIPPTVPELREWMDDVVASGILRVTDAARDVAELFRHPPRDAEWRPVLRAVAWWAFGTLPRTIREQYGVRWNAGREALLKTSLRLLRTVRPLLPSRYRHIMPAQTAERRAARPAA